jgi:hypothetical protein
MPGKYKKIDSWECERMDCGMIVVSREAHDKWHAYREETGTMVPLTKEAHEKGGEHFPTMDASRQDGLRSDGEWPV